MIERFVLPESDSPVDPPSEVEALAWIASHWSQDYLEAALALARTGEAANPEVAEILTRLFRAPSR